MARKSKVDLTGLSLLEATMAGKANTAIEKALQLAKESERHIDLAIQYADKMLRISNILVDEKLTEGKKLAMIGTLVVQSCDDVETTLSKKGVNDEQ